jgi:hypothetical protein
VVVEVPCRRVGAPADVDADVGGGDPRLVTGADDVERPGGEAEGRDGEDVVGVEGAVVGGDPQD